MRVIDLIINHSFMHIVVFVYLFLDFEIINKKTHMEMMLTEHGSIEQSYFCRFYRPSLFEYTHLYVSIYVCVFASESKQLRKKTRVTVYKIWAALKVTAV